MEKKYYPNRIKCKFCGTTIESKFTHDFQQCPCEKVFIDGGLSYTRIGYPSNMAPEDCFEYCFEYVEMLEKEHTNMWTCVYCAFRNKDKYKACERCGTERYNKGGVQNVGP